MTRTTSNERGLTLLELTVVVVLATIVMVGMVGFYLTSQATWIESSGQSLTQREGTFILERMTQHIRPAASATVSTGPTSITLFDHDRLSIAKYELGGDSLVHEYVASIPGTLIDRGGLGSSTVVRFEAWADTAQVVVTALHLRSANGAVVELNTTMGMYNR